MERAWVGFLFFVFCLWMSRMGSIVVWYIVEGSGGDTWRLLLSDSRK